MDFGICLLPCPLTAVLLFAMVNRMFFSFSYSRWWSECSLADNLFFEAEQ